MLSRKRFYSEAFDGEDPDIKLRMNFNEMFKSLRTLMFRFGQETYDQYDSTLAEYLTVENIRQPFFWNIFFDSFIQDLNESDNIVNFVTWIAYSLSSKTRDYSIQLPSRDVLAPVFTKWFPTSLKSPLTPLNEVHVRNACAALFTVFCMYDNRELKELVTSLNVVEKLTKVLNHQSNKFNSKLIRNNICLFALLAILQVLPTCGLSNLERSFIKMTFNEWDVSLQEYQKKKSCSEFARIDLRNLFLACSTRSQLKFLCQITRIPDSQRDTILRRSDGLCDAIRPIAAGGWLCGTNWMWTNFYFPVPPVPTTCSNVQYTSSNDIVEYTIKFKVRTLTNGSNRVGIGPLVPDDTSEGGYDMIANNKSICFDSYHQEIKIYNCKNERIQRQQKFTKFSTAEVECKLSYFSYSPSHLNRQLYRYRIQFLLNNIIVHSIITHKPFDNQCIFISLGTGQRVLVLSDWNLKWKLSKKKKTHF